MTGYWIGGVVRCNAFGKVRTHRVAVTATDVFVFDPVAGHYTRCHQIRERGARCVIKTVTEGART